MDGMKTPKGTFLPFLNLKGKDYLQVQWRLVWFREEHPQWGIRSTIHTVNDQMCIAKAEIVDDSGRLIADAFKREDKAHFPDYIEKATTGAVGRALALCGYGAQFAPELDEGERIVDAPSTPKAAFPKVHPEPQLRSQNVFPKAAR